MCGGRDVQCPPTFYASGGAESEKKQILTLIVVISIKVGGGVKNYKEYVCLAILHRRFGAVKGMCNSNWRASKASETLSGVYKFELVRYTL